MVFNQKIIFWKILCIKKCNFEPFCYLLKSLEENIMELKDATF